jgi:hypothetical protein
MDPIEYDIFLGIHDTLIEQKEILKDILDNLIELKNKND